jgi:hypothetical protein
MSDTVSTLEQQPALAVAAEVPPVTVIGRSRDSLMTRPSTAWAAFCPGSRQG